MNAAAGVLFEDVEAVCAEIGPVAPGAIGPENADAGLGVVAETKMHPAQLSTGMAATDDQLTAHDDIAALDLQPRADGVKVGG